MSGMQKPSPRSRPLNLKVGRAWAIKEACARPEPTGSRRQCSGSSPAGMPGAFRSRLGPVKDAAATLKRHLAGELRFVKHSITNGAEGVNSKIMTVKRKAGGFRNPANFTTAIYFHCGGLDLYPR
jgi:transposase